MKFKVKDGLSYYIKSKPSDYVIEALAIKKGITVKEYMEWIKTTPGYSNLKKFWKGLDKK
tara:strand:+ start:276 stop:455 length:180 start_codon:yes stop_codon:yes gene_type:complete